MHICQKNKRVPPNNNAQHSKVYVEIMD